MNRDDLIRMAREAGIGVIGDGLAGGVEELQRFAHLIASHVAEECAKACESHEANGYSLLPIELADAIRSLYKPTA